MLVICFIFLGTTVLPAKEFRIPKVAVIISRDIRPYIEAAEGLSAALSKAADVKVVEFSLEKFKGKNRIDFSQRLAKEKIDLFVAIGPGATRFVWKNLRPKNTPMLYSIVLNPNKIFGPMEAARGISLNIPVQKQLEMIAQGIPSIKCFGILYDPVHNSDFFRETVAEASSLKLRIIPLTVSSKKDIPAVLKQHWKKIDALWLIPDRTVISESIVQYVTKKALFKKIPVIGFNRFFYESGAALSFVFNYKELGRQCAQEVIRVLAGNEWQKIDPTFQLWVNAKVMRNIGIHLPEKYPSPIRLGP